MTNTLLGAPTRVVSLGAIQMQLVPGMNVPENEAEGLHGQRPPAFPSSQRWSFRQSSTECPLGNVLIPGHRPI